jgi:hypothetical protein
VHWESLTPVFDTRLLEGAYGQQSLQSLCTCADLLRLSRLVPVKGRPEVLLHFFLLQFLLVALLSSDDGLLEVPTGTVVGTGLHLV